MYEVRVLVPTLEEASKLLKTLAKEGYDQVSMGPPGLSSQLPAGVSFERVKSGLNRLNDWIILALYEQDATKKGSGVTTEKVVSSLQKLPETGDLFASHGEGIVSRTVSMVASSVLGDKLAWVAYEKTQPRRFWLTEAGLKKAQLLRGSTP